MAEMVAPQLEQNQRQQQASVGAVVAGPAADRVLQDSQVLEVAEAQARQPEFRCLAARANHGGNHHTSIAARCPQSHGRATAGAPVPVYFIDIGKDTVFHGE